MIVGLTGGIGSGKSSVAGFFKELGVPVYNSDEEAKLLMAESAEVKKAIIDLFGPSAYQKESLNKKLISQIVFQEKEKLKRLNEIVHPAVRRHFEDWVVNQSAPYIIQETALIFENEMQDNYDVIILVTAPEDSRIERVIKRDNSSISQVKARIKNQLPDVKKVPLADYTIENIDLDKAQKAVHKIHKQLLSKA